MAWNESANPTPDRRLVEACRFALKSVFILSLSWAFAMGSALSPAGGTLVLAIPTNQGLVIAADRRTTPRGIYCDGVRKILLPNIPGVAVFITGIATMSDMSTIPDDRLCEELSKTRAPIDFGRATVAFIEKQTAPLTQVDGQQLTEALFTEVRSYIDGGQLRSVFGQQRLTTILIASFDHGSNLSRIWQFWVNYTGPVYFQLQPLPVRTFSLDDKPDIVPFGENEYYFQNVLAGVGRQFVSEDVHALYRKSSVARVSEKEACDACVSLIDAATKAAELIKPPSGIGGGVDCALIGQETKFLEPRQAR